MGRMRVTLALAAMLLLGCAGVEGELKRASMRESLLDLVQGRDRGAGNYGRTIDKSVTTVEAGRYQYKPPAYLSQWMVEWSVRGLGGTATPNLDYLAFVVDRLLFVMAHDPTGAARSLACEQLGRTLVRFPVAQNPFARAGERADQKINVIAQDLNRQGQDVKLGKKVPVDAVVERVLALEPLRPPDMLSARQVVRVFAAQPVATTTAPRLREVADRVGPGLLRDSILVSLADVACGNPLHAEFEADPSPLARASALEVLTRSGSDVAKVQAIERLKDPLDPAETDPDVRRRLLAYLGALGGVDSFAVCVVRLGDVDPGVRFFAQQALVRITGAQVTPTAEAWRSWAQEHPEWLPTAAPGGPTGPVPARPQPEKEERRP